MAETVPVSQTDTILLQNSSSLLVHRHVSDGSAEVVISGDFTSACVLHWGVIRDTRGQWQIPPDAIRPEGSAPFGETAVRTPFSRQDSHGTITIRLDPADFPVIEFALFFPEENRWDNNRGRNYRIDLGTRTALPGSDGNLSEMEWILGDPLLPATAVEIIEKETGKHSWTLMHRFNLCYDLLDRIHKGVEGMALIFTWLRFSAIRQLDWQRNYNTKPRELSHALDRLTFRLAGRYLAEPGEREMIRLIFTTLGRGGDGQRIRDEILNIMHRHHIKEVSGHFMEEWHQKLHNNTTPDDVVICEAYLQFLRHNGDLDLFYRTLADGGVTRRRLQSYERPIHSDPGFIPHLKDVLIHDFEHFLGILKAVHSATDLGTAIYMARRHFDPELHGLMDYIWQRRNDRSDVSALASKVTAGRRRLSGLFSGDEARVRDLLLLDIALEDFLRVAVEQNLHASLDRGLMLDLVSSVLANILLSGGGEEFGLCLKEWEQLRSQQPFAREWSLHAKAVLERLGRAVGSFIDKYCRLLQPKAELLGKAFSAEIWTISLFSEEVVRGRLEFVLSMLIRRLDPVLRETADLGDWQVISRGTASGRLEVVPALRDIQGKAYEQQALVFAEAISGDEEVPRGVGAIITPVRIDILSHIAVRARNSGIVFATCFDAGTIQRLKALAGHELSLRTDARGDVVFEKGGTGPDVTSPQPPLVRPPFRQPVFSGYAVPLAEYSPDRVGGKAYNLKSLREVLPEWIGVPDSVSLPFGVFEKVMAEDINRHPAARYGELMGNLVSARDRKAIEDICRDLKETVLGLRGSETLASSIVAVMEKSGIAVTKDWEEAWTCIKKVWASKWNLRACLSRMAHDIPHRELLMSVLIQEVVDANCSFVIHTVNPLSGSADEIYAEVVLGLGEALVGNFPGKSLSFSVEKKTGESRILSFPDKDEGLYGAGLIFRSDSSGEDLAGFAGAGLYDSFILPEPRRMRLDYSADPLIRDETFRKTFMENIGILGNEVERSLAGPQDIEGAYSNGRYWVVQSRPQVGIR